MKKYQVEERTSLQINLAERHIDNNVDYVLEDELDLACVGGAGEVVVDPFIVDAGLLAFRVAPLLDLGKVEPGNELFRVCPINVIRAIMGKGKSRNFAIEQVNLIEKEDEPGK